MDKINDNKINDDTEMFSNDGLIEMVYFDEDNNDHNKGEDNIIKKLDRRSIIKIFVMLAIIFIFVMVYVGCLLFLFH